ncbi:CDP-alcohol phosphatidyltransferase family protein [Arthrobacter cheniae]|uniref:CDP-alcohol phosphatidyltransferase family protein n=1 Tax=Arthrobacter cheniae TaxID=1258888 RepID=A0A3A5M874_9MICC|nr:CDP-alcohol phosphatidyltransferase family protein [Arthrobacter cheniae]RJT81077.1 CDP-alcohol phosphatidyltransferase family protein [Arthrobacter cheniae]
MFDTKLRPILAPALDRAAALLDVSWISPNKLTGANLVLGMASAGLAAAQLWVPSLIAWLLCRLADGLDGPLARRRAHPAQSTQTHAQAQAQAHARAHVPDNGQGGFWDICADFVVYGATVIGVAVGATAGFGAPWLPFLLVLFAYYINGSVFLAFSSIAEKTGRTIEDGRSLSFLGGLAEGTETVVVHSLWLLLPFVSWQIALIWALLVSISATERIISGYRRLR